MSDAGSFDPTVFVGRTVAYATHKRSQSPTDDMHDVLAFRFTDGSSVTITTADTDHYCSWMEFEAQDPDGEYGRAWMLHEARQWLAEHAESARVLGWDLALCGSTILQGRGRDLDVVAVPNAPDAANLPELWDASEWNAIHQRVTSPTGVECRVYEDQEGRLIDIAFFPLRPVHPEIQIQMRRSTSDR